jgi:hypothetical protein
MRRRQIGLVRCPPAACRDGVTIPRRVWRPRYLRSSDWCRMSIKRVVCRIPVTATPGRQRRTRPRSRPERYWRTHHVTYEANSESGPRPRSIRRLAWTNNWPCRRGHQQQIIYPAAGLAGQRRNRDRRQPQNPDARSSARIRAAAQAATRASGRRPSGRCSARPSAHDTHLITGSKATTRAQTPDSLPREPCCRHPGSPPCRAHTAPYRHPGRSGSPLLPPSVDPKPELNGRFLLNR